MNDLHYALRSLRHNTGFALTAIISIALGIGANAAIFSLGDGLILRPLPVPDATEIMVLRQVAPSGRTHAMSYRDFEDFRDQARSFQTLVGYSLENVGLSPDPRAQAQSRMGVFVSGNFFSALGVRPAPGRDFLPEETRQGATPAIILGHTLWTTEFRRDPGVVGRRVRLNGIDHTVVGVAPETFYGLDLVLRPAFFLPVALAPRVLPNRSDYLTNRESRGFTVKGLLKNGVSQEAATAEAQRIARSLAAEFPATNRAIGAVVFTEMQDRIDDDPYDTMVVAFLGALVLVVLAIACANVANLMLSRGRARAREIAVRLAIGASRTRLVRQLLIECLVISGAGAALGLLIARTAVRAFSGLEVVGDVPVKLDFRMDERVLLFTVAVSVASALLFGLIPALRSTRTDLTPALKSGEQKADRGRLIGRNALVMAQVAGSVALVIAATQVGRGFSSVLGAFPGYERTNRLTMRFDPQLAGYDEQRTQQFYRTLVERARNVPGVSAAALASILPLENNQRSVATVPEGYQFPGAQRSVVIRNAVVDENYFETMGVPVIQGRAFRETDGPNAPRVIVVNEHFARLYLGPNPVGKRVRVGGESEPWSEVVGVTSTGKYMVVAEPPAAFLYRPHRQNPWSRMTLIAHTRGDAAAMAQPLKEMVAAIDAQVPMFAVRTLEDIWLHRSVNILGMLMGVINSVGALGLGLALIGLYAVVSYQVSRRTREIGVRMAVGADAASVLWMILRQAGAMGAVGVAAGMAMSLVGSRLLSASPIAAPAMDTALFLAVPMALLATTVAAAVVPARRAAAIDPLHALRQD